jgi:hypothetical protein
VSSALFSKVRNFLRLVLARLEHLPAPTRSQWNPTRSVMAVEGALMFYIAAALLIALRVLSGSSGLLDSSWVIGSIIVAALTVAWALCRGIESEQQTDDVRIRIASTRGIERFKESGLGVAFLVGALLSIAGASYFATR